METYTITEKPVTISSGILRLEKDQAKTRAHNLKLINPKAGTYEIINPVEFKVGEVIGYDGDLGRDYREQKQKQEQNKEDFKSGKYNLK